jgi:hypothetical protein
VRETEKEVGVPADLAVKKGAARAWPTILLDFETCADLFDRHLAKEKK